MEATRIALRWMAGRLALTQPSLAGMLALTTNILPMLVWWSWGELNPRPQAFFAQFYMCSRLV